MKINLLTLFTLLCLSLPARSQVTEYVCADKVHGIKTPRISLNGTWDFFYSSQSKRTNIKVPGEAAMQGYAIEHDKPIMYVKKVVVPNDFNGNKIILRFDGVYSQARLWVNGTHVRNHSGGFTRWEADITNLVKVGRSNEIKVEVTDRIDDISYASGYAHHPIGGILRNVTLYALPQTALSNLVITTELDSSYRNAILRIKHQCNTSAQETNVTYKLLAPDGQIVNIQNPTNALSSGQNEHSFAISNPVKWDAEHPNLYTLQVSVNKNGKETYHFERKIGFRKIEIKADKMLVNGKPVKLRGACRHDIHPTLGRTTTTELDSLDVILFKQSNMNFVRTSHYPPSEAFINFCDRYGIYVECETAVCFVETYRPKKFGPVPTQSNPDFTAQYLGQCQEMYHTFASNSSVVIWSVGNESTYGTNIQQSYDWLKQNDTGRPVIFSYPGSVPKDHKAYDILSMHYQDVSGNLNQWGMATQNFQGHNIPALFDEWAHPACYTQKTLQNDPNIREFWGQSLNMMWSGLFDAPGGLGGAIWGYIDETFMLPKAKIGNNHWNDNSYIQRPKEINGNCTGYGEWGIVDVWRRHKPEFWSTKKAYSPIRVLETNISEVVPAQKIILPLYNRFDHTNLNEIKLRYTYQGQTRNVDIPSVEPHNKGAVVIPAYNWESGSKLFIEFLTKDGELIDAELISLGQPQSAKPQTKLNRRPLKLHETESLLTVQGDGFEIPFEKSTGLITNAISNGEVMIVKGPFLNLEINLNHLSGPEVRKSANKFYPQPDEWKLVSFSHKQTNENVEFFINGIYKTVNIEFHIIVNPSGNVNINYFTTGEPNGYIRESGLMFKLPSTIDHLTWQRKGYWSYYPEGDFAGNEGKSPIYESKQAAYGEKPVQPWGDDTHNYFYWSDAGTNSTHPLTQKAKGMKENIYNYTLTSISKKALLSVISTSGTVACRINKPHSEQLELYVNNRWDYPEIAWGNYCKKIEVIPTKGSITIQL